MDYVSLTIDLIGRCVSAYDSFKVFKPECRSFHKLLLSVREVLEDIEEQFHEGSLQKNTRLGGPLERLREAVKDGHAVLEKCRSKKKVQVLVRSKHYIQKLDNASSSIRDAMQLISASGVAIQGTVLGEMEKMVNGIHTLVSQNNHEVANIVREELDRHGDQQADQLFVKLKAMGIVRERGDFEQQLRELQEDKDRLLSEKVIYDRHLLDAILKLSLTDSSDRRQQPSSDEKFEKFKCPISLDYMRDPVVLMPSGNTYDREYLCSSLLAHPNLDPKSGIRYDQKLMYADNIVLRSMLMEEFGDGFYQRYNDSHFGMQYDAAWEQHCGSTGMAPSSHNMDGAREPHHNSRATSASSHNMGSSSPHWDHEGQHHNSASAPTRSHNTTQGQNRNPSANQADADVQFNLGWRYDNGRGVPKSDQQAARHYRLAADQGHADAQFTLGCMYANGRGMPWSDQEAAKYFHLAADQGHAQAHIHLGYMYKYGKGVPQSFQHAVRYYRLAADRGHAEAQNRLGQMYTNGQGVPQNHWEAARYYRMAADGGHAVAQFNLGVRYERGQGVPQSHQEAAKYYRLAADQGDVDAQTKLRSMKKKHRLFRWKQ